MILHILWFEHYNTKTLSWRMNFTNIKLRFVGLLGCGGVSVILSFFSNRSIVLVQDCLFHRAVFLLKWRSPGICITHNTFITLNITGSPVKKNGTCHKCTCHLPSMFSAIMWQGTIRTLHCLHRYVSKFDVTDTIDSMYTTYTRNEC